ncbi:MAG: hypothetical protein JW773_00930, partial [Desulfuromonadales bacterium]|nr:hypothetical protein [Desulfuromonadales bacterium]
MQWLNELSWNGIVEWINLLIAGFSQFLASLGVPEAYQTVAALGIIYLGVTLAVLLFILVLLKILGSNRKQKTLVETESSGETLAEAEAE